MKFGHQPEQPDIPFCHQRQIAAAAGQSALAKQEMVKILGKALADRRRIAPVDGVKQAYDPATDDAVIDRRPL